MKVLEFDTASEPDILDRLATFEVASGKHKKTFDEALNDSIRAAIVIRQFPEVLMSHVLLAVPEG